MFSSTNKRKCVVFNMKSSLNKSECEYITPVLRKLIYEDVVAEVMLKFKDGFLTNDGFMFLQKNIIDLQNRGVIVSILASGICDASILALSRYCDCVVCDKDTKFTFDAEPNHIALQQIANNEKLRSILLKKGAMGIIDIRETMATEIIFVEKEISEYLQFKGNYLSITEHQTKIVAHAISADHAKRLNQMQ